MKNSAKVLWGIFFIVAAIFLIMNSLYEFPQISVFSLLLAIFLVWILINSVRHLNFFGILFSIALILCIFDKQLGVEAITPWPVLGAALLGSIGLSIVFHKKPQWAKDTPHSPHPEHTSAENCTGDNIHCENNFGTTIKYINSDHFQTATIENNFGALSVYFDNALIQGGTAIAQIENNFGEIHLFIPKSWSTQNHLVSSLGSINETGRSEGSCEVNFLLEGKTNFGAIQIHYV